MNLSYEETYYIEMGLYEIYEQHKTKCSNLYERYRVNHNPIIKMQYKNQFKTCVTILQLMHKIDKGAI